jgi:hypothetical protein
MSCLTYSDFVNFVYSANTFLSNTLENLSTSVVHHRNNTDFTLFTYFHLLVASRLRHEADHSPLTTVEVRKTQVYMFTTQCASMM